MAETDADLVDRMAKRHSISPAAVQVVLTALRSGGGRMAQFSHADFGGMSQWSPGMSMVGDMFNTQLKAKLDALCTDIAAHLDSSEVAAGTRSAADEVSYRSMSGSTNWWPARLGRPGAVGAQNDLRYAVFPDTRRLVIDDRGEVSVYDTGDHRIFGVAQAQSSDRTLSFTSQDGLVRVADLTKVAV
jgi:ketosteroid isomerase-like protein